MARQLSLIAFKVQRYYKQVFMLIIARRNGKGPYLYVFTCKVRTSEDDMPLNYHAYDANHPNVFMLTNKYSYIIKYQLIQTWAECTN